MSDSRQKCGCIVKDVLGKQFFIIYCSLHAAAPDLLAACRYALSQLEAAGIVRGDVAAAIAVAEGR